MGYTTRASLAPGEGSEVRYRSLTGNKTREKVGCHGIADPKIPRNSVRPHRISHQVLLVWVISQEEYILLAK